MTLTRLQYKSRQRPVNLHRPPCTPGEVMALPSYYEVFALWVARCAYEIGKKAFDEDVVVDDFRCALRKPGKRTVAPRPASAAGGPSAPKATRADGFNGSASGVPSAPQATRADGFNASASAGATGRSSSPSPSPSRASWPPRRPGGEQWERIPPDVSIRRAMEIAKGRFDEVVQYAQAGGALHNVMASLTELNAEFRNVEWRLSFSIYNFCKKLDELVDVLYRTPAYCGWKHHLYTFQREFQAM